MSSARNAPGAHDVRDRRPRWQDELTRRGAAWRLGADAPALSLAVALGDLEFAFAWGWADPERRLRATPDVRFACGSISKQFVAAAVLQLCERGVLALDAPVSDYVPGVRRRSPEVTLRHLLSHTAGVEPAADALLLADDGTGELPPAAVVARWDDAAATAPPGRRFAYSNAGYFLLGLAVQRASGLPWRAYLRRHLLSPAGLPRVGLAGEPGAVADAVGHRRIAGGFGSVAPPSPRAAFASGDVFATAGDLVRWARVLAHGSLVAPASFAAMTTPVPALDPPGVAYGFAHYDARLGPWRELSHDGQAAGFSTQLAFYPERDVAVAVLLNGAAHHAERIAREVAAVVLGATVPAELVDRRPATGWPADRGRRGCRRADGGVVLSAAGAHVVARFPAAPSGGAGSFGTS